MGICPKCKQKIDSLLNIQSGLMCYHMTIDKKEIAQYQEGDFDPDDDINIWRCPECYKEVANDSEKAEKILQRKKKW